MNVLETVQKLGFFKPVNYILSRNHPYILWKYIMRDFFFSFFITFIFFVVIFVVNQMLLLTKNILQIDIPFSEVGKLIFFALPSIFSMSIPFATLVACLMSVGHFSTFNEFVAMKANGVSFLNIFFPYIFFSFVIMGFSLLTNEVLLPWGSINFSKQYRRILNLNPQLGLEQNSIKRYQENIIVTKQVNDKVINGIIIIDDDSAGDKRIILANSAQLKSNSSDNGIISIELNNINSLSTGDTPNEYNYLLGDKMFYNILLKDLTLDVQTLSPDQQSSYDLYYTLKKDYIELVEPQKIIRADNIALMTNNVSEQYQQLAQGSIFYQDELASKELYTNTEMLPFYLRLQEDRDNVYFNRGYRISEIVFFRKLAFPVAVVLFVIIAFPMGTFYKRSGRTVGFGVGLILSFVYWFLIILNQSIGVNTANISPLLVMWYPNLVMLVVGIFLLIVKRS